MNLNHVKYFLFFDLKILENFTNISSIINIMNKENDNKSENNLSTTCEDINRLNILNYKISNLDNSSKNLNLYKKFLFYQLKKLLLNSKKYVISNENTYDNNVSSTTDILSNYSHVNYHKILNEPLISDNDKNIISINGYLIFKNELIGNGRFTKIYKAQKKDTDEIYVKFF